MKSLLVFGLIIIAGYYILLTATMNMAVSQTMQIHRQYESVAAYADQIAAGEPSTQR